MNSVYCSTGHENPSGSRFCLHCGEKLDSPLVSQGIQSAQILGGRYAIVRQVGQGGFGRTYLAEDINRFRELCILKEFSPQVQTPYVLQKAEELFEREASVLYRLQHSQIPRFRELFRTNIDNQEYLILVQDYVEGQTYRSLLEARKQQNLLFTEQEVHLLLHQILPVLDYIHSLGVIHRDISPDNLILRTTDQLPVLIDFGGVKQVAATVVSQYYQPGIGTPPPPTLLGKVGYAPPEQMQTGLVEPHSDLYALAVTVLVLLTGKQPQELIDTRTLTWEWQREVKLSSTLGGVLNKMLSPAPQERYHSASEVLQALTPPQPQPVSYSPPQPPVQVTQGTVAVTPQFPGGANNYTPLPTPKTPQPKPDTQNSALGKTLIITLLFTTVVGIGVWGTNNWIQSRSQGNIEPTPTPTSTSEPTDPLAKYSPEERQRKQRLGARRQQLGIDYNFYIGLVNQVFWERNPSLQGRILTDNSSDESLRAQWDKTAAQLLDKLALLSSEARRRLGTYTEADRNRWKVEVNNNRVGSRSLYDLGDAAFFQQFPEQRGKNFIDKPIGQVWHGFVADKLSAILVGRAFQRIVFDQGATSSKINGTLKPGEGKVFIAGLAKDQQMEVKLDANSKIWLSVYSPTGKFQFLEDSTKRSLSVKLPEDGFYEYVVVSNGSEALNYTLYLTAENPTPPPEPEPTPTETPTPEPTPTETPTPEPTPTETPTPEPTPTETPTPEPTPTETPTPEPTPTET
jgi:serine/threonine-protein kinase